MSEFKKCYSVCWLESDEQQPFDGDVFLNRKDAEKYILDTDLETFGTDEYCRKENACINEVRLFLTYD